MLSFARISGRYRIIDRIGAGRRGVVYLVEERESGRALALKVLPRRSDAGNLGSAFLALTGVHHPNLVRIHDHGLADPGHDFFVMDHVGGPPLARAVPATSPHFYRVVAGILRGVAALHARGLVHGALGTSSILLDPELLERDPLQAPRLADACLSADPAPPCAGAAGAPPPRRAPEVYAGAGDARSDLYALGAVLHEMLTGAPAFAAAASPAELLAAQRRGCSAGELCARHPQVPAGLAALVASLLEPVPAARPQSAAEVLARLGELAGEPLDPGPATAPLLDPGTVLIGRERDLGELSRRWQEARSGCGSVVLLAGEEGTGKTRLLGECRLAVQLAHGQVQSTRLGSCEDGHHAQLAPLVRALMTRLGDTAPRSEWYRPLVPLLTGRNPGDCRARFAVAEGLSALVAQLAAREPLLLIIDDLHRASAGAADILAYLARSVASSAVLLILAGRDSLLAAAETGRDDEASARGLRGLVAAVDAAERGLRLLLPPLDRHSLYRLAEQSFGAAVAGDLAGPLHRATGGNPAQATQLLQRLVATGTLVRRNGSWLLERRSVWPTGPDRPAGIPAGASTARRGPGAVPASAAGRGDDDAPVPGTGDRGDPGHRRGATGNGARGALDRGTEPDPPDRLLRELADAPGDDPLHRLSAGCRVVLAAAAALGDWFSRPLLLQVMTGLQGGEGSAIQAAVDAALGEAAAARLLLADAGAGHFALAAPALRERLARELAPVQRKELHRAAAALLERQGGPATALARHHLALGELSAAAAQAVAAGEQYEQLLDLHCAIEWYERALTWLAPAAGRRGVHERLGALYARTGASSRACHHLRTALDACGETDLRPALQLHLALGELLWRTGQLEPARALVDQAIALCQHHRLDDAEGRCLVLAGRICLERSQHRAAAEQAVAAYHLARSRGDRPLLAEVGRLRADLALHQQEIRQALQELEGALADAEAGGDEALVASILLELGRAAIHAGEYGRAAEALEKAIALDERAGRIEQVARALNNLGAACYFQGDWQRTRQLWEQFRRLCERLDERAELVSALNNLGSLYRELGALDDARAALERGAQVAAATGHARVAAMIEANRGEVLLRQGDLAAARRCYEGALARFTQLDARADVIETQRRLCELDLLLGRVDEALDRAIDAARDARDAGIRLEEGILHRVVASALRRQKDTASARWFIERAREILTTLGARYERARLDLETAELAAAEGQMEEAERHATAAIEAFAQLGARWDLAQARAQLRLLRPEPVADRPRRPPGLLLDLARATAMEPQLPLEKALDTLLAFTGFDRGFLLLLDGDGKPRERLRRTRPGAHGFGRGEAAFSGSLVQKVATSGRPVAFSDISDEKPTEEQRSVLALGLRRVMCAPMRIHGRVIGAVYVDSHQGASSDGDAGDLELLEGFAAQAALLVENARLTAEEQRKSELMAILAHEIRNPLSGILGYSELTEEEQAELGARAVQLLSHVHRDAERLRRLVDNVLELARREHGAGDGAMGPVQLGPLIDEAVASFRPLAAAKQISIAVDTSAMHGPALGNGDRLLQVLNNLLSNAVKFTPRGGHIEVRARREAVLASDPAAPPVPHGAPGAWAPTETGEHRVHDFARVDVSDSGPGMSEETRARLFEKFGQHGQRRSGIGLGLYISREIVRSHGGSLWVESEAGEGSVFSFRIPVA